MIIGPSPLRSHLAIRSSHANVRIKSKLANAFKFACERSDAFCERSQENWEQWIRMRIANCELSGDGPYDKLDCMIDF